MNSPITFPVPAPELKLARSSEKWQATLAEERRRLQEDQEALRDRETNLREYEARLRAWQAEIDAAGRAVAAAKIQAGPAPASLPRASSRPPMLEDPALQLGWEKL